MRSFWSSERAGHAEWLKISLVRVPKGNGGVYHVAVMDDWSGEVIKQMGYDSLSEAVAVFEGLCAARELLLAEVD